MDAEARWIVSLDASSVRKEATSGKNALEQLRESIQKGTANLNAMQSGLQRLKGTASVKAFEAGLKDLSKAHASVDNLKGRLDKLNESRVNLPQSNKEIDKLQKKLSDMKETMEIAKMANVKPGDLNQLEMEIRQTERSLQEMQRSFDEANTNKFNQELAEAEQELAKAQAKFAATEAEVAKLNLDPAVQQAKSLTAAIEEQKSALGDMQQSYGAAGGDLEKLNEKTEAPKQGLDKLAEAFKGSQGPIGGFVTDLSAIKAAGPVAALVAIVTAIIAITAAAYRATVALAHMLVKSASAEMMEGKLKKAAVFGDLAGVADIDDSVVALRNNVAITKDEAIKLSTELHRLGFRGQNLKDASVTIERFGLLGEETKGRIRSLYQELAKPVPAGSLAKFTVTSDMLPRDVFVNLAKQMGIDSGKAIATGIRGSRDRIASALKAVGSNDALVSAAKAQMLSFDKQVERLNESIDSLFNAVNVEGLLTGLDKLLKLLDESSVTGQALRKILASLFNPLADAAGNSLPVIAGFLRGMVAVALVLTIAFLKVRNVFRQIFGGKSDFDWVSTAFWVGVVAATALTVAVGLLTLVLFALATSLAIITAPIWLPFVLGTAAVIAMVVAVRAGLKSMESAFSGISWIDKGKNLVVGLVQGIVSQADKAVTAVTSLADKIKSAFTTATDQHSPSRIFKYFGRMLGIGARIGIEEETPAVQRAADKLAPMPSDMINTQTENDNSDNRAPYSKATSRSSDESYKDKQSESGDNINIEQIQMVFPGIMDAGQLTDEAFRRRLSRTFKQALQMSGMKRVVNG